MPSKKTLPELLEQEKISAADIRQLNPQTKIEIEQRTTLCTGGLRERIHWLQRGFHAYPNCEQCQQPLSSKNFRINYAGGQYTRFCGYSCSARNREVRAQREATVLQKYGSVQYLGSAHARQKIRATNLERYGTVTPHPWQSNAHDALLLKKYGSLHPVDIPGRSDRITRSLITQNIDTGKTLSSIKACEMRRCVSCENPERALDHNRDVLENVPLRWRHLDCGHQYECAITDGDITVCPACHSGASALELSLRRSILEICPDAEFKKQGLLSGKKELDIWIPSCQVAIEFNGIYWHSVLRGCTRNYHLDKTKECLKEGIQLIHIWENQFLTRERVVLSIITNAIGQSQRRVGARQCTVRAISPAESRAFVSQNHISDAVAAAVHLGLFFGDELLQVMTFGRARFTKNVEWEILRLCSAPGVQVQGGAGRLFKYFCRYWNPKSVVSFSDRCIGEGQVYQQLGFCRDGTTQPSYFWANTSCAATLSRYQSQRRHLQTLLGKEFDPLLSESENMRAAGWFKLWNCGHVRWIWSPAK